MTSTTFQLALRENPIQTEMTMKIHNRIGKKEKKKKQMKSKPTNDSKQRKAKSLNNCQMRLARINSRKISQSYRNLRYNSRKSPMSHPFRTVENLKN